MSSYVLYLPEARGQAAQEVAQAPQTSLDDLGLATIADKVAAVRTAQYVRTRIARADQQAFLAVLERIKYAARPVVEGDER